MYKILSNILSQQSIETVFGEIFRYSFSRFEDFFNNLNLQTKYGKKRMVVDLNYLQKKLQTLKFNNEELVIMINQKLSTIIKSKELAISGAAITNNQGTED